MKSIKTIKRSSSNVKNYIGSIFEYYETAGKRPNFEDISKELKTKRNEYGCKEFIEDEWLSPSQIRRLFANLVRKNTTLKQLEAVLDEEMKNDEDL